MKSAVEKRGIKFVYHFTRLENLGGILSSGIILRATLESNGAAVNYNDPYRYDDCTDASCFSIGFPNYKMFWGLRKDNPGKEWVVIACKPDILWLKDCVFCYENAASDTVTSIPLKDRKGVDAFERLFSPAEGKPSRKELGLSDHIPTNPQAEVLVFGIVEPKYIAGVICQKESAKERLEKAYPNFAFERNQAAFNARKDYASWR